MSTRSRSVRDSALAAFDIVVQIADIETEGAAVCILDHRKSAVSNELAELPRTDAQVSGSLAGAQQATSDLLGV